MKKQYIHYGSSQLYPIQSIHNMKMMPKPFGGLWASPTDSPFGWYEWCRREHFNIEALKTYFKFTLTDNAKIFHIYKVSDLDELPKQKPSEDFYDIKGYSIIDFEELQKTYDGIELHLSEEIYPKDVNWSYQGLYWKLYGWDCDSILLFNSDVIKLEERFK